MLLLLPSDPLSPRRPDEHFAPEADAAPAYRSRSSIMTP